jgi:hypothetical protein
MFKEFTGIEYLAIDVANGYGLDKESFEYRIQWVKDNQKDLEDYAQLAEEPHLFNKSVAHFRKALKGLPSGHAVALDSCASGLQLMSVMTGCKSGCYMTGLIDPDKRMDAYSLVTGHMNDLLGDASVLVPRKDAKQAIMTSLYGSKAKPRKIFGDKSPAYNAFYEVLEDKCKGAYRLLNVLISAWDSKKDFNHWVLPDGFNAYVPVMQSQIDRVKVEELEYTMSVQTWLNQPLDYSVSLAANVVHSVDAYVLRTLVRRCNYNVKQVTNAIGLIQEALKDIRLVYFYDDEAIMPVHLFNKTGIADISCLEHLPKIVNQLPQRMLKQLLATFTEMLKNEPFEVITTHDSFACLPNHCNVLRWHYKEILAMIAESTMLDHLLSQLFGEECIFSKLDNNLAPLIRNSNYGLS